MESTRSYTWEYANETITLGTGDGISEEWIAVLEEMDRQEYNNEHRERRRCSSLDPYMADEWLPGGSGNMTEALELEEMLAAITAVLSAEQIPVFCLRFCQECSAPEVAAALGLSEGSVRIMCCRIRKKLQKLMQGA